MVCLGMNRSLVLESVNNSFCNYKLYHFWHAFEARKIDLLNLLGLHQPGVVAHACNPVAWRVGFRLRPHQLSPHRN